MSPDAFLAEGARLMIPKLEPLGYRFEPIRMAAGSGGEFAEGRFARGDRRLDLWARRDTLGGVRYSIDDTTFDHKTYMTALGKDASAQYPGLPSQDRFGGFRRLLADLDLCPDFLDQDASGLLRLVRSVPPLRTGFTSFSACSSSRT